MQDGIFAKKDIKNGDLICYYSGMLYNREQTPIFHSNMTFAERYLVECKNSFIKIKYVFKMTNFSLARQLLEI